MNTIQIACCQAELTVGNATRNRELLSNAIEFSARAGAQIVVLPELANSGYVFRNSNEAAELAESLNGITVNSWLMLALRHNIVLIGGLCETDGSALYNSAVIIDQSGLRAVYRKAHLWNREKLIFSSGTDLPPVVETTVGRIGTLICYDLEFPEWVRMSALDGAELLCVPTNWPVCDTIPSGERPMEIIRAQASAAINRMYIAVCDRAGTERGVDWIGGSVILDPNGWPLASSERNVPGNIFASCNLTAAGNKWISDRNNVHDDRRPELYTKLTDPNIVTAQSMN